MVPGYAVWMLAASLGAIVLGWIAVSVRRLWQEGVGIALLVAALVLGFAADPLPHATHLGLMTGFFAVFLAFAAWDTAKGGSLVGLVVLAANAGLYYAGAYVHVDELRHDLLGGFTVVVAVPHLALGAWALRVPERRRAALMALGVSLSLLVLAVPVQLAGFRITIAWALQALALLWIARRTRSIGLRIASVSVFVLAILRVLAWDLSAVELPQGGHLLSELLGGPALAVLATALSLAFGARLAAQATDGPWPRFDRVTALGAFVCANALFVGLLALESYVASGVLRPAAVGNARESLSATLTSVSWAVWGVTLVAIGMARGSFPLRIAGLSLVGLTVGKVYVFDVWMLGRTERIVAFVALGGLLLGASWAYARFRPRLAKLLGADAAKETE